MLLSTKLRGPAKRCPVCGTANQACGSPGHMTSIHEVSTAGGNLIATEAIWRESSNPGVYVLAYAPGDVVRPEDQHLVRKAVPKDKAMRGPREKPKETKETP